MEEELEAIRADVEAEMEHSIEFAMESPEPEAEEALLHVYSSLPEGAEL